MIRDFTIYLAWLCVAGALISGEIAAADGLFPEPEYQMAVR